MNSRIILIFCTALGVAAASPARAELVTNGGFEDNDLTNFVGWVINGTGITVDSTFPASGAYDASFGATSTDPSPGILSQSLATTAGTPYLLTFALADQANSLFDSFTVTFGNFSVVVTGDAAAPYTAESFLVAGSDITGSTTTLSFQGTNDNAVWNLDDVSVTSAIPEPSADILFGVSVIALPLLLRRRLTGRVKQPMPVAG